MDLLVSLSPYLSLLSFNVALSTECTGCLLLSVLGPYALSEPAPMAFFHSIAITSLQCCFLCQGCSGSFCLSSVNTNSPVSAWSTQKSLLYAAFPHIASNPSARSFENTKCFFLIPMITLGLYIYIRD